MRKALLQRLVADAAAGSDSPIGRCACTSRISTPATVPTDGAESPSSAALGHPHSCDVVDEALSSSPSFAAEFNPARPHENDSEE